MPAIPKLTDKQRDAHLDWLTDLTAIPTAAGQEDRVIAWIEDWLSHRPGLALKRDKAGNLLITNARKANGPAPIFITAHLDHPAFVVHSVSGDSIELEFRGGVNGPYFAGAKIEIFDSQGRRHPARIENLNTNTKPFKRVTATLSKPKKGIIPGDIGRWVFPKPRVKHGELHTNACDDLAAVAAALAVVDVVHKRKGFEHVGLLFTRAEEIGFIGAIAACKLRSVPKSARLICLENSRSFAESPIGGGPILRVGDKMSVFGPGLTNRIGDILLDYQKRRPDFRFQRKLMPGGTCEATTFSTYGYASTCVCLPLGNYHNMCDIDGVASGRRPAKVGREFISIGDYHGLIELLLIVCAQLDDTKVNSLEQRMEKLFRERGYVVGMG